MIYSYWFWCKREVVYGWNSILFSWRKRGSVLALKWNAYHDDNNLSYVMALRGDPHRIAAYDYGSDIGIDPLIKPGDRVVYVRMTLPLNLGKRRSSVHTGIGRSLKSRPAKSEEELEVHETLRE